MKYEKSKNLTYFIMIWFYYQAIALIIWSMNVFFWEYHFDAMFWFWCGWVLLLGSVLFGLKYKIANRIGAVVLWIYSAIALWIGFFLAFMPGNQTVLLSLSICLLVIMNIVLLIYKISRDALVDLRNDDLLKSEQSNDADEIAG